MDENEITDWILEFDLSEKIAFLDAVTDSAGIKFKTSGKYVTGFIFTLKNLTIKEAEKKGKNKAMNLKNILTIISGVPIEVYLKSLHSEPKPGKPGHVRGSFRVSLGGIEGGFNKLDANLSEIQSIINSQEPSNLKYEYASKGIFYYYNLNPIECIKELFKVIVDQKTFFNYNKYEVIRNIFSHSPPYKKETIDSFLKIFNPNDFEFKKFVPNNGWLIFDIDSNKNLRIFNSLASRFISDVRKYLKLEY
jgi:hypothetical protein